MSNRGQRIRKRIGRLQRDCEDEQEYEQARYVLRHPAHLNAADRRQKLRALTIVDDFKRECLAIEVDTSLPGSRVVAVLERLRDLRGLPSSITVDHGPKFEGQVLDAWAYKRGVRLAFIRPGKPVDNCYIESFNGACVMNA